MNPFLRHEPQGIIAQESSMLDTSYPTLDSVPRSVVGIAMGCNKSASLKRNQYHSHHQWLTIIRTVSQTALISGTVNWLPVNLSVGDSTPPEVQILT